MPAGRPTDYTPEIVEKILLRMYSGESVREICRDANMPSRTSVDLWRVRHPEFTNQYAHARRAQVEARIEDCAELLSNPPMCNMPDPDGGVTQRVDGAAVQLLRARADLAKWEASKLLRGIVDTAPLDYGDRMTHAGDADNPISISLADSIAQARKRAGIDE